MHAVGDESGHESVAKQALSRGIQSGLFSLKPGERRGFRAVRGGLAGMHLQNPYDALMSLIGARMCNTGPGNENIGVTAGCV
jgi:hypothetical protein